MENENNRELDKHEPHGIGLFMGSILALAVLVFVGVFGSYIHIFGMQQLASQEAWGQFGDFVGGLTNPILSFLGLVILLQTFRFQLAGVKRQLSVSERDKFEATFFRLVDRAEEYAEFLFRSRLAGQPSYADELRRKLRTDKVRLDTLPFKEGVDESRKFIRSLLDADTDQISSYGRKCSQCFYFVDDSKLSEVEKEFYFSYIIESFHRYEYSLYLTISFVWSPRTVEIIRAYKLAKRLRASAFCSSHVHAVFTVPDIQDVYPPISASTQGEQDIQQPS